MSVLQNYFQDDEGIDLDSFKKEDEINIFKDIKTKGFQLLVRLYIPPKKIGSVFLPDASHDTFQYKSCVGLVVQKGPAAYGKRFDFLQEGGDLSWCDVGDWVVFARHEGIQMKIHGKPCQFLNDSSILAVISSPEMIAR